ncbi:MAG: TrmH family RNA methyltransferase [Candidatus Woesebacteria bacterium]|nr:TrmH family RNA methyltransferase [Candidatus Woesebacteria bacterium]
MKLKLNSKQLRKTKPVNGEDKKIKRNPIYVVLDNIIDTYNIGSIFRLADAVAIEKVFICGDSDYPPSSRIHKAAVGTEEWVPWKKTETTVEVINKLKLEGIQTIAVEQNKNSIDYRSLTKEKVKFPCAIIVGNETTGISKEVLDLVDLIVELPMFGVNKSFNVWGTAAVVVYKIIESL